MNLIYWTLEFAKVLFAYFFVLFIWPSVVFRKYLHEKSKTFRFSFCLSVQIVLVNTIVLGLGLLHLLNEWTVRLVFYGIFLFSIRKKLYINAKQGDNIRKLITGTYGWKHFFLGLWMRFRQWVRFAWNCLQKSIHTKRLEYGLLLAVLIFGAVYYNYGAFQDYSYGFGDMYVHHSWIYGLSEGTIFSKGVYPEGMHCVIYAMSTIFGIRFFSSVLFTGGIHSIIFLLSAYCLMKEVFRWRYTPILVLTVFLTLDLDCINEVYSMSRLQWTLPQEFGLPFVFLCGLYLYRYIKGNRIVDKERYRRGMVWDDNLLVFTMALSASIAVHFYTTIMAFFLCLMFAVCKLRGIFCKAHFIPLITAVIIGAMIAVIPMGAALLSGTPFEKSIGWAIGVMEGEEEEGHDEEGLNGTEQPAETEAVIEENTSENIFGQLSETMQSEKSLSERIKESAVIFLQNIREAAGQLFHGGYRTLYRESRAMGLVIMTVLAAGLWLAYRLIVVTFCRLFFKKSIVQSSYFDSYVPIIGISVIFMVIYAASAIGLPPLIAGSRLCSIEHMFLLSVVMMPVDMLFCLLRIVCKDRILQTVSVVCAAGIYLGVIITGNLHGYLYYELTRYNAAVDVVNSITQTFPRFAYTIVSVTDELYQVNEYGRHEELLSFVLASEDEDYYFLPTEYVFIFVEKNPIRYAQNHFFDGPSWLGTGKYADMYKGFEFGVNVSQCPDIVSSQISSSAAEGDVRWYGASSKAYSELASRTVVHSKASKWCEDFKTLYGNEMKIYYEDENFLCYYFKQNPNFLYNLAIWK